MCYMQGTCDADFKSSPKWEVVIEGCWDKKMKSSERVMNE